MQAIDSVGRSQILRLYEHGSRCLSAGLESFIVLLSPHMEVIRHVSPPSFGSPDLGT
jgi:hypothetical protein